MRLLKQALGVLGALVVLAVIVAFVAPKKAHALAATLVQIVPGSTTHVGQNESQLVALICSEGNSYCSEESPAGSLDPTTSYAVPTGSTLIVTDYSWASFASSRCSNQPDSYSVRDFLFSSTPGTYQSSAQFALTDKNGTAALAIHFASGLRVASGVTLGDALASNFCGEATVHGYLVPN
jgi:hypothetical protein